MSSYAQKWDDAKKKFENDTGMKKPAEMGKTFGVSYRKGTGVDSALEDIDKVMPKNVNEPTTSKIEKALNTRSKELDSAASAYLQLLEKSLKAEKEQLGGKDASLVYRDLKILRASLEAIVAAVTGDIARLVAARVILEKHTTTTLKQTAIEIRVVLQNLDKQCKAGLLVAQGLLKTPDPKDFNDAFPKAARDITQCFAQFRKWTMPDELHKIHRANRDENLTDPAIYDEVKNMYHMVEGFQRQILQVIAGNGNSPLDADLERMANNPPKLPSDSTPDTVKAAVKHYVGEVKRALGIAEEIRRM